MITRNTLKFYGIWALIGAGIMCIVVLTLLMLEWRPVYQYQTWYKENPAPEVSFTAKVVRNPLGQNWLRVFVEKGEVRVVDFEEVAPPGVRVVYRQYSYRLVFPDGEGIDIYGAGEDVRQVRLLQGLKVDVIGKRVWFRVEGKNIKEEFWPKRIRVSDLLD